MPAKSCVAESPTLIWRQFLRPELLVALLLLLYAHDHVQDIQRIEHDLEILIRQQLNEEVKEPLRIGKHVFSISFYSILHIVENFIDRLRSNSPIVLRVHHPLDLFSGDQLAGARELLLGAPVFIEIVVVDVGGGSRCRSSR